MASVSDKLDKIRMNLSAVYKDMVCDNYLLDINDNYYKAKFKNIDPNNRAYLDTISDFCWYIENYEYYQIPFINKESGYIYDIQNAPHALISGKTGSGKSYMLYYMLTVAIAKENDVYIIDRKNDLAKFRSIIGNEHVVSDLSEVLPLIKEVQKRMIDRETKYAEEYPNELGFSFSHVKDKVIYLFIDEMSSMLSEMTSADKKEFMSILKNLLQRGRSAGVNVVLSMQQPNANVLPTELRDQIGLKVVLGNSPRTTQTLVFSADDIAEKYFDIGSGYFTDEKIQVNPSVIFVPTVKILYDLTEIKNFIDCYKTRRNNIRVNGSGKCGST